MLKKLDDDVAKVEESTVGVLEKYKEISVAKSKVAKYRALVANDTEIIRLLQDELRKIE